MIRWHVARRHQVFQNLDRQRESACKGEQFILFSKKYNSQFLLSHAARYHLVHLVTDSGGRRIESRGSWSPTPMLDLPLADAKKAYLTCPALPVLLTRALFTGFILTLPCRCSNLLVSTRSTTREAMEWTLNCPRPLQVLPVTT